jgi:polyisoprenoid-binding protein YceI
LAPLAGAAETTWRVSPGPSSVEFSVRHLLFSKVEGSFRRFSGSVTQDLENGGDPEDFSGARIHATIPVKSIYTGHRDRDRSLQEEDFFWAGRHPAILFESRSVTRTGAKTYRVVGDLTIRGVQRRIELEAEYLGQSSLPSGELRADFELSGSVNRYDYGLRWNEVLETGGALVGAEVEIRLKIAVIRVPNESEAP